MSVPQTSLPQTSVPQTSVPQVGSNPYATSAMTDPNYVEGAGAGVDHLPPAGAAIVIPSKEEFDLLTGTTILTRVMAMSHDLKEIFVTHKRLTAIKDNAELVKRVTEVDDELNEHEENIGNYMESAGVEDMVRTLGDSIIDVYVYLSDLQRTTIMFFAKGKLKSRANNLQHALRTKCTQLFTRIMLATLTREQEAAGGKSPKAKKKPLHDTSSTHALLRSLPLYYKTYTGIADRAVNHTKAFTLAKEAAEEGDTAAMIVLAKCYFEGTGTAAEYDKGMQWLEKAVSLGDPFAKKELAEMIYAQFGDKQALSNKVLIQRTQEIEKQHRKKSKAGSEEKLGEKAKEEENLERAIKLLLEAAEAGITEAETLVGIIAEDASDYQQALGWYKVASEAGCCKAMNKLGLLYFYGRGVEREQEKAQKLFMQAALGGNRDAYNNAGICFEYGQGVMKDVAEALRLYERGANLGCPDAMYSLGYLLIRHYILTLQRFKRGVDASMVDNLSMDEEQWAALQKGVETINGGMNLSNTFA